MDKIKNLFVKILFAFTLVILFYFSLTLQRTSLSGYLKINFLDVGQGDSVLVETPQGKHLLIDAGPSESIVSLVSDILPPSKKNIDLAILTHPHSDHLNGFNYLSEYYVFDQLLQLPINHSSEAYVSWLEYLSEENVSIKSVYAGDFVEVERDLKISVLWPENESSLETLSLNDSSIVFLLEYFNFKVLFMGDAEILAEEYLVINNLDLSCSVIKAGHHGSSTSSSEEFISNVLPQVAIISVGEDNKFNHPSNDVISLFEKNEVIVYRTDEIGSVKVVSDGKTFWVE